MLNTRPAHSAGNHHERSNGTPPRTNRFVGVGIGPANLSLAALSQPVPDLTYQFYERRPEFTWHPGLAFPAATLQVSFLKDLVTLVDPTNRYSFLSFLATKKRMYRFLTANFPSVLRAEYDQYFHWASTLLPGLNFDHEVSAVDFDERTQKFRIETTRGEAFAENMVLGTGLTPTVPTACLPHLGNRIFHASEFTLRNPDLRNQEVVLLGGGQSGAEVFLSLLRRDTRPRRVTWVTRRSNFLPLDDSPFTNELFFPNFARYFHGENRPRKQQLLREQKLASDGITLSALDEIYRELYTLECIQGESEFYELIPDNELVAVDRRADKLLLSLQCAAQVGVRCLTADTVVLCTGYEYRPPDFLAPLLPRIGMSGGRFDINKDYSLDWDGPAGAKIYLQNAGRHEWGAADPNLSLLSWRSAVIINDIVGYPRYDVANTSATLCFGETEERSSCPADYSYQEQFDEAR